MSDLVQEYQNARAAKTAQRAAKPSRRYTGRVTGVDAGAHLATVVTATTEVVCVLPAGLATAVDDLVRVRVRGGDYVIEQVLNAESGDDPGTFAGGSAVAVSGDWEVHPSGVLECSCSVTITPSADNTWTATVWTFPVPFQSTPRVIVGNASAAAALTRWGARNQTALHTDIGLERTNTNATTLDVYARGRRA